MSSAAVMMANTVLEELRQLPPHERLCVIAQALPEVERELRKPVQLLPSLRGLWQALGFNISAEEIDEARREAWAWHQLILCLDSSLFDQNLHSRRHPWP